MNTWETQYTIYRCLLPKKPAASPGQTARALLAQAEAAMQAVAGISKQGQAGSDQVTFELVAHKGVINFYIVIPDLLDSYIQEHFMSSYPDLQLEAIDDYNIFLPQGTIDGKYLVLTAASNLQLKTYVKLVSDPLELILGVLDKLGPLESAAIQFVTQPAPSDWLAGNSGDQPGGRLLRQVGKTFLAGLKSETQQGQEAKAEPQTTLATASDTQPGNKGAKPALAVTARIIVTSPEKKNAELQLENIVNGFSYYNARPTGNALQPMSDQLDSLTSDFIHRQFNPSKSLVLNTEEMVSLWHLPLPGTVSSNIAWLGSRSQAAPARLADEGIRLGRNLHADQETIVRLKTHDRRYHLYIIGAADTGKSVIMQNLALQDAAAKSGLCVIDPQASIVTGLLESMPSDRYEDVIIFDPADEAYPVGLNIFEVNDDREKESLVQAVIAMLHKLFPRPELLGPMFEHNISQAILTLLADQKNPGTLIDLPRLFTDEEFRQGFLNKVTDPVVRRFWEHEVAGPAGHQHSEMLGYLISKIGGLASNGVMRNILGQAHSGLDFRQIVIDKKILLCNLDKDRLGELNSSLLGLIVLTKLDLAARAVSTSDEERPRDYYLYIDEFHDYATDTLGSLLAQEPKHGLSLILAQQSLAQLGRAGHTAVRDAVLGNVGNFVSFRVGVDDAATVAQLMAPAVSEYDLVNLKAHNAYVKMMLDSVPQSTFCLETFAAARGEAQRAEIQRDLSRHKYSRVRVEVERELLGRAELTASTKRV